METSPLTVIAPPAVKESEGLVPVVLVRFPAIVIAPAGNVFAAAPPLPERVRLP
jgi:hypothetical protein